MVIPEGQLPHPDRVLIAALDYGTTHATRAYLLGLVNARIGADGQPDWLATKHKMPTPGGSRQVLVILAEFAPPKATVGEHARLFELWLHKHAHLGQPEWIAVDPAAATFKMELFERGRSDVINAHNRVVPGIQMCQSLFYAGHLFVGPECPELVKEMPGYMWSTKATEKGNTEPVKENDDAVDAMRYAVFTSRREWRALIPIISTDDSPE